MNLWVAIVSIVVAALLGGVAGWLGCWHTTGREMAKRQMDIQRSLHNANRKSLPREDSAGPAVQSKVQFRTGKKFEQS
jgi:hypothetical protein